MQIDELRGELTSLADEIEPFAGDATALHRRVRARRIITASCAVALAIVVAVSTAAVAHNRADNKIHISGTGSKEVAAADLTDIDYIVVPGTAAVEQELEDSPLVARFALLPQGRRLRSDQARFNVEPQNNSDPLASAPVRSVFCSLEVSAGIAVETVTPGAHLVLPGSPAFEPGIHDLTDEFGFDAEIFMTAGAQTLEADQQTDLMRSKLLSDADVSSSRFISQDDAYSIFKQEFADQPALVESTKASDLPASFRIRLRTGASADKVTARYQQLAGVQTVITPISGPQSPRFALAHLAPAATAVSACTTPVGPLSAGSYDMVGNDPPILIDHVGKYSWQSSVVIPKAPVEVGGGRKVNGDAHVAIKNFRMLPIAVPGGYSLRATFEVVSFSGTAELILNAVARETTSLPGG